MRIELYGTEGLMCVERHGGGWQVFGRPQNRRPSVVDQMHGRYPDPAHQENFVQCIRTRQRPNADIEDGHRSTLLIHFANVSCRLGGQKLFIDPQTESFTNSDEAKVLWKREYREPWVVPEQV
jgi:hypothetical protein